ncbi:hypothetical protein SAMN04488020_1125 [Palleronia marisminoris]|uniref:Uncharacterized protein n=1 Tax=Palleronia marisminoris TaxID=315423 RepID=A0A1Y5TMJ9_9RHOB|nr:hypothetical protein [Palleronia marisminoris]SFH39231.1 hypothetical protein SAMN04488020_1125 [Palleronia marisminoris]SLN63853.1 hypothetical protein PAM7066_03179 [Palleronia marisminoris]
MSTNPIGERGKAEEHRWMREQEAKIAEAMKQMQKPVKVEEPPTTSPRMT